MLLLGELVSKPIAMLIATQTSCPQKLQRRFQLPPVAFIFTQRLLNRLDGMAREKNRNSLSQNESVGNPRPVAAVFYADARSRLYPLVWNDD